MVSTPLNNISQLGGFFPIYGKIKNVPNHQSDVDISCDFHGICNQDMNFGSEKRLPPIPRNYPLVSKHFTMGKIHIFFLWVFHQKILWPCSQTVDITRGQRVTSLVNLQFRTLVGSLLDPVGVMNFWAKLWDKITSIRWDFFGPQ